MCDGLPRTGATNALDNCLSRRPAAAPLAPIIEAHNLARRSLYAPGPRAFCAELQRVAAADPLPPLWVESSHCSRAGKRNVSRHLPPYARFDALGAQPGGTHRAAASALSSGRVLKAMGAAGADLRTVLTTASNSTRCRGGRRTPAPITTQS
jgi:hypothetical protein